MKKIANFVVKHYKIILIIFIVLTIASMVAIPTVYKRVNSDLTSYLPNGTMTSDGQKFLKSTFGIEADAIIGIQGATQKEVAGYVNQIENLRNIDGKIAVTKRPDWLDPDEDDPTFAVNQCMWIHSDYFTQLNLLYSLLDKLAPDVSWEETVYTFETLENILYSDNNTPDDDTDDVYVLMLILNYGPSTNEAFSTLDAIEKILADENFYIGGSTQMAKSVFESTIDEVWKYSLAGVAIVLFILLITTKSYIEPLILLITLGVSIILNMGTNIIFPSTSIITFSASAILQLALSMDYAIFFLHAYRDESKRTLNPKEAVANAIPIAFKTVFSSALTTAGGFLALLFMRFTIGIDLGLVLAKGIVMSFLSVILLEPVLVILFRKKMVSWEHKSLDLKFRKPIKRTIKHRSVVVACLLIALFPVVLIQSNLGYGYFDFVKEEPKEGLIYEKVDMVANQLVISIPLDLDNPEDIAKHFEYIEELREIKNPDETEAISFILGLNALLPEVMFSEDYIGIIKLQSGQYVALDEKTGKTYSMYTIGLTNPDTESTDVFDTVSRIEQLTRNYFSDSTVYITGMAQAARDFASITPTDFMRVSIVSVVAIFVILLILFRSLKHSLILILIIQFGIWINLAIQKLFGQQINFMSYIIISSIQLGATVDYAILITNKYRDFRKRMLPHHAAYQATTTSVMSVLTSSSILAGACFCVYFMTSNIIVAEITMLIARGAIISALLVFFVLPSVLAFMDRPFSKKVMDIKVQNKIRKKRSKKKNIDTDTNADKNANIAETSSKISDDNLIETITDDANDDEN